MCGSNFYKTDVNLIPTKLKSYVNHQAGIESAPSQVPFQQSLFSKFLSTFYVISLGLMVRRPDCHPRGPGSIPCLGIIFCLFYLYMKYNNQIFVYVDLYMKKNLIFFWKKFCQKNFHQIFFSNFHQLFFIILIILFKN